MIDVKGKKIAVIGLGVEGLSSALFLARQRAQVTVLDQKPLEELDQKGLKDLKTKGIKIITGEKYLENLSQYEILVRSPGVKLSVIQGSLKSASKKPVITSQTKLFFEACPCPIIGVTGTKGKGTTSSLIYQMLKKQRFDVYLGGNIGVPPFEFIEKLTPKSWVVLELSSFQLQDLHKSPHIAVMLMVVPEHMNYHKDEREYIDAKINIFRFQKSGDYTIINRDYPASLESDIHTEAKVYQVSREREVEEGCFVKDGKIIVGLKNAEVANDPAERDVSFPRTTYSLFKNSSHGKARPTMYSIINTKDILLPGEHNLENICAAVMAAVLAGVSKANIVRILKTFKGLKHRLELIGEVNRVKYYDDSFSTTPETAIAAIQAFKAPEILILGGSSKGSDFTQLGRVIRDAENTKAIIGIGEEWHRIKSKIKNKKSKIIEGCKNMKEIIQKASEISKPGDVVLLSPACASFGMFKNYKERGEQFKREVENLKYK